MEGPSSGISRVESSSQESCRSTESKDEKPPGSRFRVLAYTMGAVRNFSRALNPSVDFRKHNLPEDAFSATHSTEAKKKIRQNPELLKREYTHSASGRLVKRTTRTTSGNKTYYLMKALFLDKSQA